jgi:hypothetical protein
MAASGLTLSGGAGTLAVTWGELRAEDVAVRDSEAFGVYVAGRFAALVLERVTVEGTTTDVDGDWGAALWAESGAAVTASSVRVSGAALLGFVAVDAEVSLSGCTVADTPAALVVSGDDGVLTFGAGSVTGASLRGAEATNGAALSVDGSTFADGAGVGVHLADDGTTATLDDVVVDGVAVNEEGFGVGVWVDDGATATVTGCSIQGAAEEGLRMQSDAIATLHDSSIIATGGHGAWVHGSTLQWEGGGVSSTGGTGVAGESGALLTLSGIVVEGATYVGVELVGASAVLAGVTVAGTGAGETGEYGHGAQATAGSSLQADGLELADNPGTGLFLDESEATVADLVARDGGTAIDLQGGELSLAGATLERHVAGIQVGDGGAAALEDVTVAGTTGREGFYGLGVAVADGAEATLERCAVEDTWAYGAQVVDASFTATDSTFSVNRGGGILAAGSATISLTGVEVRGMLAADALELPGGVMLQLGASGTITDSVVGEGDGMGIYLVRGGTLDLTDVTVTTLSPTPAAGVALGVAVADGGDVRAERLEVRAVEGPGLLVVSGGALACRGCTLADNAFAAAAVGDGELSLEETAVSGTLGDASEGGGVGVYALDSSGKTRLALRDVEVGAHPYAGLWLVGGGSWSVEDSDVTGGTGVAAGAFTIHGNAVYASGAGEVALSGCRLHDAVGTGVLLDASTVALDDNTWADNTLDLRQQACGEVAAMDASGLDTEDVVLCDGDELVTDLDLSVYLPDPVVTE